MQETHCLLTSCNNAGSEKVQLGFDTNFIAIDEARQLTVAALAKVLTETAPPYQNSDRAIEFWGQGETSILTLLDEKGYPVVRLILQYQMAPSNSGWVVQYCSDGFFYNYMSAPSKADLAR